MATVLQTLHSMHAELYRKRIHSAPYDLPTASDVLGTGAYPRLPRSGTQQACGSGETGSRDVHNLTDSLFPSFREIQLGASLPPSSSDEDALYQVLACGVVAAVIMDVCLLRC
jgi:hypothetical protein